MAKLPRGYKLTSQRVENGAVVCAIEIAWWRKVQLLWRAKVTL